MAYFMDRMRNSGLGGIPWGLIGGAALAYPFVRDVLPMTWTLYAQVLLIPVVFLVFRLSLRHFRPIPTLVWLSVAVGVMHFLATKLSNTGFASTILYEIQIVAVATGIFLLTRYSSKETDTNLSGFFKTVLWIGVPIAFFSLVKAALLERGIMIDFMFYKERNAYPPGASLRTEYNLFALTMIVVAIGLVRSIVDFVCKKKIAVAIALSLMLSVVAVVIFLTGSRRGLIIGAILPPLYFMVLVFQRGLLRSPTQLLILLLSVWLGANALLYCVYSNEPPKQIILTDIQTALALTLPSFDRKQAPSIAERVEGMMDGASEAESEAEAQKGRGKPGADLSKRKIEVMGTDPTAILGTINANEAYGLGSRLGRWQMSIDLLRQNNWLSPSGFAYHEAIACQFFVCGDRDYPHMALLSEWLIGGLIGLVLALAWYAAMLLDCWKSGQAGWSTGATPLVFAALPFAIISGDTLFSIPQLLTAGLFVAGVANSTSNFKRDAG